MWAFIVWKGRSFVAMWILRLLSLMSAQLLRYLVVSDQMTIAMLMNNCVETMR